ncbi:hypothetical protein AcdelDRAFT_0895 [Acidovorax delafieldii 2AN]|uniref:Rap1a immunity protein domain-containing protein n=1 Tax=Acidovorax delafieldii 2AN TaxID=573060 RepID=C5T1W5_ACIDE|nr:hypothetical protein AcdelDRAFT_0895 [Acidovorax delafieldii 2AN]
MRFAMKIICTAAIAACSVAHSADSAGKYYHGGGVGSVECPEFVNSISQAKTYGFGTPGYVNAMHGYTMFVSGFQSAYNMLTPNTCEIFPAVSSNQALSWVENYCRKNPLAKFATGVAALAMSLHSQRLQSCPR